MNLVIHDFELGWDTYIEKPGYVVESNIAFSDVKTKDYKAVLILGGRAPEFLRHDAKVIAIVKEFDKSEKYIFSLCHGIQILAAAGLAKGNTVTCYENCRFDVESVGGIFNGKKEAVKDGRIVTGQTWQSHPDFYRLVFECLTEK